MNASWCRGAVWPVCHINANQVSRLAARTTVYSSYRCVCVCVCTHAPRYVTALGLLSNCGIKRNNNDGSWTNVTTFDVCVCVCSPSCPPETRWTRRAHKSAAPETSYYQRLTLLTLSVDTAAAAAGGVPDRHADARGWFRSLRPPKKEKCLHVSELRWPATVCSTWHGELAGYLDKHTRQGMWHASLSPPPSSNATQLIVSKMKMRSSSWVRTTIACAGCTQNN